MPGNGSIYSYTYHDSSLLFCFVTANGGRYLGFHPLNSKICHYTNDAFEEQARTDDFLVSSHSTENELHNIFIIQTFLNVSQILLGNKNQFEYVSTNDKESMKKCMPLQFAMNSWFSWGTRQVQSFALAGAHVYCQRCRSTHFHPSLYSPALDICLTVHNIASKVKVALTCFILCVRDA